MTKKRITIFACTMLILAGCVLGFSTSAIKNMNLGLDLKGGFEILYEVKPLDTSKNKTVDMKAVASAVSKRVNVLGVSEPDISVEGQRIRVQLAGIKDIESARNVISSSAVLTFRDTSDKVLMDATVLQEGGAALAFDQGTPIVSLKIADTTTFASVTKALSQTEDTLMVSWLDYKEGQSYAEESQKEAPSYISAATVKSELTENSVTISGGFSEAEAQQLVDLLNSGSLNFQMNEVYSNVVSPDLGEGSFDKTIFAGMVGIIAIMAFMLLLYRFAGIVSSITLAAYTLVVLIVYTAMGGVFTLSGIAGLVLGVGMAVDSSVITFERIKDCLLQGRSVKQAYKEGTAKSFSTIFDSQLTTMISALILYLLGTGSVKGFATMLLVSTVITVAFNVSVVRFALSQVVKSGWLDNKKAWFNVKENDIPDLRRGEKQKKHGPLQNFDFIKGSKYFIMVSVIILIVSLCFAGFNASQGKGVMNLGIDFSSGTRVTFTSDKKIDSAKIDSDLSALGIKVDSVKLSGDGNDTATVAIKKAITKEERIIINKYSEDTFKSEASDSTVSPVVGHELIRNAFLMSLFSWLGILIYVSIRFKWDYAVSGIVALVHDVLIILGIFAIFRMEVTTDIIAVLLAIIGYSINDTIVGFDRMREHEAQYGRNHVFKNEDYRNIVNTAMQETIVRSIITTITTMIPVTCLLVLGSSAIFDFNIALMLGLVAGSYSSIFIAAQLWYYLRCKNKNRQKNHTKKRIRRTEKIEEYTIPGIND